MNKSRVYPAILVVIMLAAVTACMRYDAPESPEPADPTGQDAEPGGDHGDELVALGSGVDREAMDTSTRPVDDFYQYVNGGWLDSTPIPAASSTATATCRTGGPTKTVPRSRSAQIDYAMSRNKCKYQQEARISRLTNDPHSPLKYRVNGVYRNIDAFHEAFGTQQGDGMWLRPQERVSIW